jgi:hypothetical protein
MAGMAPTLTDSHHIDDEIPTTVLIEDLFAGSRRRSVRRHNDLLISKSRQRRMRRWLAGLLRRAATR